LTADATVWVVRAGRGGRYADGFRAAGVAAIGWTRVGDLGGLDRAEVAAAVRAAYGERGAGTTAGMLHRFASEIAIGDWVLMPHAPSRSLHGGRVTGAYEHRAASRYPHVRPVAWDQQFGREELAPELLGTFSSVLTVFRPAPQEALREFLEGAE
jgi:predicted Mrr-cat superfamily restriction endonuclease